MSYTYEVNKDKTVTIFREGSVCVEQTDDPATDGYDAFTSKARAEEWAKEAIKQYAADEEREANLKHALGAYEQEKETLELGLKSVGENNVGIVERDPLAEEAPAKK
jgi:viroplasmin and RNaseH domain-containing protein